MERMEFGRLAENETVVGKERKRIGGGRAEEVVYHLFSGYLHS